ncbi:Flagellar hook-associated protein flgK [Plantibacter sp. T3]|nr:Flagellar hook-associated protein flgK [Plantibacter sp. T3]
MRLLREGGDDDRPRAAALARGCGQLGEPRGLLSALQQREGRPHADGDELEPPGLTGDAARLAVDGAGRRALGARLGAVPGARRLSDRLNSTGQPL